MKQDRIKNFIKTLGPGILFASTAIGVSHLVQSTRAGANFGFALIPFILAANIFKYPFFEFGSRYANVTGESLIDGYKRIGKWMLWLYILIVLASMFFVTAAVGAVTSGFLQNLFGITSWGIYVTIGLFIACAAILMTGKYKVLDSMIKVIGFVLLFSTLLAFVLALFKGAAPRQEDFIPPSIWTEGSVMFIIALMGWMPTAVDLSTWNSLWTIERIKQTGYKPKLSETLADFNFGYIISAVLSICFVTLGAYTLFGSGTKLPETSGAFANSVVGIFSGFIGEWSYIIIAAAAFSIMFGTCIAVFDGYARTLERCSELVLHEGEEVKASNKVYSLSLAVVAIGGFSIVFFFGAHLKDLVDLAMTISFLIAPVISVVNFRLVTGKYMAKEGQPKFWLKLLSWAGILFQTGFAVYFVWVKFNL